MTFSILTFDEKTGTYAAAAATGSLCVGGWVLRGDIESGLVASQGTAPSTFWRDDALRQMYAGERAETVVAALTEADAGRSHRQLSALDRTGRTAAFTGADSIPFAGHDAQPGLVLAGNMLTSRGVLSALAEGYRGTSGHAADRVLHGLRAAQGAGGDSRGLLSAALLVLAPDRPPLDLRVDHSPTPLDDLARLLAEATAPPYADWLDVVPVVTDKGRAPGA